MSSLGIHFLFNEQKAINAILFISEKLNRKDFHKIFKILYFSDRDHLVEFGRPITGDNYIAMTDGPVPSNIYDIFKSVRGDGYYKDNGTFNIFFSIEDWDLISPKTKSDIKYLSKTDINILSKNIELYGNLSWDELKEKSHDYAWRSTAANRTIDFSNLMKEAGSDNAFIDYVKNQSELQSFFTP